MGNYINKNMKEYTTKEVANHNTYGDGWVILSGYVYDISTFKHPGGMGLLTKVYGTDATKVFYSIATHGSRHKKKLNDYLIGKVKD